MFERYVVRNSLAQVRSSTVDGRPVFLTNFVSIRPGVLNGSHGGLFYGRDVTTANVGEWNGVDLVVSHPRDQLTGQPISAEDRRAEPFKVGHVANDRVRDDGARQGTAVIDKALCKARSPELFQLLNAASNGASVGPIEVSTGIFTETAPEHGWDGRTGEPYTTRVVSMRPDHLAILLREKGACSVSQGCGLGVNARITKNCGGSCGCKKCSTTNDRGDQPRDPDGRFASGGGGHLDVPAHFDKDGAVVQGVHPEKMSDPGEHKFTATGEVFQPRQSALRDMENLAREASERAHKDVRWHATAAQEWDGLAKVYRGMSEVAGGGPEKAKDAQLTSDLHAARSRANKLTGNSAFGPWRESRARFVFLMALVQNAGYSPNTTPQAIASATTPLAAAPSTKPQKGGATMNDDEYDDLCQPGSDGWPDCMWDLEDNAAGTDTGDNEIMTPAGAMPSPSGSGGSGLSGSPIHLGPAPPTSNIERKFWAKRARLLANARTLSHGGMPMSLERRLINNMLSRSRGDVLAEPGLYGAHSDAIAHGAQHTGYHTYDPTTASVATVGPAAMVTYNSAHVAAAAAVKGQHIEKLLKAAGYKSDEILVNVTSQFDAVDRPLGAYGDPLPFGLSGTDPTGYSDQSLDAQARDGTTFKDSGRMDTSGRSVDAGSVSPLESRDSTRRKGSGFNGGSDRMDRREQGTDRSDAGTGGVNDAGDWDPDMVRGDRGTRVVQSRLEDVSDEDLLAEFNRRRSGSGAWPSPVDADQAGQRPATRILPRPRADANADDTGDVMNTSSGVLTVPAGHRGRLGQ
jgi:hypothetical protein